MICTISSEPVYLIEGTPNNTPIQDWLYLWTFRSLYVLHQQNYLASAYQHGPKQTVTNIAFGPKCHTHATTTAYPISPVDQRTQQYFQPDFIGRKVISDNTTDDTPLLAQDVCDL